MTHGDILTVTDPKTGGEYDAVVRWVFPGGWARCEWIAGPEDGEKVYVNVDLKDE